MQSRSSRIWRSSILKISASSLPEIVLVGAIALSLSTAAEAQGFRLTGTVRQVAGADTTALRNQWVLLHAITLTGGMPLDSTRSDRRGRFLFRVPERDSLATYVVSVAYHGIGYFSEGVRPDVGTIDTLPTLLVYDTSSTGPPIVVAERHILIRQAEPDGSRRVVDLFVLANRGSSTRITGRDSAAVWSGRLPRSALEFEIGLSDMSEEAVHRRGDTLEVFAAIPPGERQLLVGYLVPRGARELVVPVDQPVDRFAVLLEDSAATIESSDLSPAGLAELAAAPVRRFEGSAISEGASVIVRFPRSTAVTALVSWLLVPLAAFGFVVVFFRWRMRQPATAPPIREDPASLAAQIAALDASHAHAKTDAYHEQRAELKARLQRALHDAD